MRQFCVLAEANVNESNELYGLMLNGYDCVDAFTGFYYKERNVIIRKIKSKEEQTWN